ncbi:ABC transporter ATP-binding protein/permease [Parafrankia elaeagni]|uniref:ABC transporter ATP-binding protein/permease n=1 Tax=Parafrankia elaeagni TaxID=222534 RepID=UPI00037BCA15|nr:ABC transporter ATP-binding protein/permease [Parafrankia elaeagni]
MPIARIAAIGFIAASLLATHWLLGLVVLFGAPVAVWLMGMLSERLSRDNREYQALLAATVGQATDLVAGYRVVDPRRPRQRYPRWTSSVGACASRSSPVNSLKHSPRFSRRLNMLCTVRAFSACTATLQEAVVLRTGPAVYRAERAAVITAWCRCSASPKPSTVA